MLSWVDVGKFSLTPGQFFAPWTCAIETLGAFTLLRFEAVGSWTPVAGLGACGPDGLVGATWPEDRLLLTDCAVGALVGRIGGSSASLKAAGADVGAGESKPFAIGSLAVVRLPEKAVGPLFISLNVTIRPVVVQEMTLTVRGTRA